MYSTNKYREVQCCQFYQLMSFLLSPIESDEFFEFFQSKIIDYRSNFTFEFENELELLFD